MELRLRTWTTISGIWDESVGDGLSIMIEIASAVGCFIAAILSISLAFVKKSEKQRSVWFVALLRAVLCIWGFVLVVLAGEFKCFYKISRKNNEIKIKTIFKISSLFWFHFLAPIPLFGCYDIPNTQVQPY